MDDADIELRNVTYRTFVELGRAPTIHEIAAVLGTDSGTVRDGWRRLHAGHAIVIDPLTDDLRMANPFAARPTSFIVQAAGRSWYANCAWDAFGIGAALGVDSTFTTTCPDCAAPIAITVRDGAPDVMTPVFHVLVPAADWWSDIGFT